MEEDHKNAHNVIELSEKIIKLNDEKCKLQQENKDLKLELADLKEQFSSENIFNNPTVMGVLQRYKTQNKDLRSKLKSQSEQNQLMNTLEDHNKKLLEMNADYANKSEHHSEEIGLKNEKIQSLKEEIQKLRMKLLEKNNQSLKVPTSSTQVQQVHSPSDDVYTVVSPPPGQSQGHISLASVSNESNHMLDLYSSTGNLNTQNFLSEYQTLKTENLRLKKLTQDLMQHNEKMQAQINEIAFVGNCNNCSKYEKEVNKLKQFNDTLQYYLAESKKTNDGIERQVRDLQKENNILTEKVNDSDIVNLQYKAFQEDFDTERHEKDNALQKMRQVMQENELLKGENANLKRSLSNNGQLPVSPPQQRGIPNQPFDYSNNAQPYFTPVNQPFQPYPLQNTSHRMTQPAGMHRSQSSTTNNYSGYTDTMNITPQRNRHTSYPERDHTSHGGPPYGGGGHQ